MLERLMGALCAVPGVEQSYIIDDLGTIISSVGDVGFVPSTSMLGLIVNQAKESAKVTGIGIVEEIWLEGEKRTIIDRLRTDLLLILEGRGGQLGRWRYAIESCRESVEILC